MKFYSITIHVTRVQFQHRCGRNISVNIVIFWGIKICFHFMFHEFIKLYIFIL